MCACVRVRIRRKEENVETGAFFCAPFFVRFVFFECDIMISNRTVDSEKLMKKKNKYEKHIKPKLDVISGMAKKGITEKDIALHFGVAYSTFRKYKSEYKELEAALEYGETESNAVISSALFEAAKGFYKDIQRAVKVKKSVFDTERGRKLKEWEEIEYVTERQYFPPNMGAIAFWLTNHEKDRYSKNPVTEVSGDTGGVVILAEAEAEHGE